MGKEHMDCETCLECLFDAVCGSLSEEEMRLLNAHLDTCVSCRAEYQSVKMMHRLTEQDPVPDLPADFEKTLHEKLMAAADEMMAETTEKKRIPLRDMRKKQVRILISAAACAAITIGVFSGGLYQRYLHADDVWNETETVRTPTESAQPRPMETTDPQAESVPGSETERAADSRETAAPAASAAAEKRTEEKTVSGKTEQPAQKAESKTETLQESDAAAANKTEESTSVQQPSAAPSETAPAQRRESVKESDAPQENEAVSVQNSRDMDYAENAAEEMQGYAAPSPVSGGSAMAAAAGGESRARTFCAMENVYSITVPDVHAFLAAATQKTGIAWSEKQVAGDTAADGGSHAVTLSLSGKEWDRLLQYANQCGYRAELIADNQNKSKILVTIAGEEG